MITSAMLDSSVDRVELWSTRSIVRRWLATLIVGACGGSAVVIPQDEGGGGAGGTASSTSTTGVGTTGTGTTSTTAGTGTTTGGAGGAGCAELEQELVEALEAATACDPTIYAIQCSGSTAAMGYCSCLQAANDLTPALGEASVAIGMEWAMSGCEYNFCEGCYPLTAAWFCNPTTQRC